MADALARARSHAEEARHGTRKRPYQPTLAAYFHPLSSTDAFDASSIPDTRSVDSTTRPALPGGVQASLLNVGMRVRKAVGDGYRVSNYTTTKLEHQPRQHILGDGFNREEQVKEDHMFQVRELTPMCGMHKIGNHDFGRLTQQRIQRPTVATIAEIDFAFGAGYSLDFGAGFPSSQESNISNSSTDSVPAKMKKRGFDAYDDEDEDAVDHFAGQSIGGREFMLVERSVVPPTSHDVSRRIANATSRVGLRRSPGPSGAQWAGGDGDFEDARFLVDNVGVRMEI